MPLDAWSTRFDRTWLREAKTCRKVDEKVATLLARHRGLVGRKTSDVFAFRTEVASAFLSDAGKENDKALVCATVLALIGELLICAETGGILNEAVIAKYAGSDLKKSGDKWKAGEATRHLRNALCHPASQNGKEGEVAVVAFLDHVETEYIDETWVADVRRNWGALASREVAFFALQLVNDIGRAQAAHWHIPIKK